MVRGCFAGNNVGNLVQIKSIMDKKYTSKFSNNTLFHVGNGLWDAEWPPQSPDYNPITLLWDELDRNVRKMQSTNTKQLGTFLKTCWNKITPESLDKLISRIPRVCAAVIQANGGYFEKLKIK